MKLADYQIEAIVNKIDSAHKAKVKASRAAILKKESPAIQAKAKKVHAEIMKLSNEAFQYAQVNSYGREKARPTLKSITDEFLGGIDYSSADEHFDRKSCKDDVIIASISCENMDQLSKKLGIALS